MCVCMLSSFSCVWLFLTLWTISWPGSSVHGILSGKNTGVGCHALLQGIFPTQRMNLCLLRLLHCRWILYSWANGKAHNIRHIQWTDTWFLHTHTPYIYTYIYTYKYIYIIYPINELQFSGSSELAEGVELIRRKLLRRISIEVHIKVPNRG